MNLLWLFGLLCLSAGVARSQNDVYTRMREGNSAKFCGANLANMLSMVCRGIYKEYPTKRNLQLADFSIDDYAYDQPSEEPSWPFLSAKTATSLVNNRDGFGHRRYRRQVVEECCRKACTISEMRSYCGN